MVSKYYRGSETACFRATAPPVKKFVSKLSKFPIKPDIHIMVNVEELPQTVLVKIFSFVKYNQLVSLRRVSRTFCALCSEILNVAFLNLEPILQTKVEDVQKEIKATECPKRLPSILFRYKIVQILEREHRVLLTVCGRHVRSGTYCFVGGTLLDYFYKLVALRDYDKCESLERSVTVQLFLLCEDFADHFEVYVEPNLVHHHSLLGTKIVDLLDCFLDSNYHLIVKLGDDGSSTHVVGGYEVYSSADGISSPPLAKAPVDETGKADVTRLVRYLRNTVRWHNLCHCIEATSKRTRVNRQRRRRLCLDLPGSVDEDVDRGDHMHQKVFKRNGCRGEGKGFKHGLACSLDLRCMNKQAPRRMASSTSTLCNRSEVPEIVRHVGMKPVYEFTMKLKVRYSAVEDVEEVTKEVEIQLHETDNICFMVEHTVDLADLEGPSD